MKRYARCATLFLLCVPPAFAACPESVARFPDFIELAVDEKAPRPQSADDFKFIGDTTTLAELTAKVGPPDGSKGPRYLVYCLADGTVITVTSKDGADIREVRVNRKILYKRK